MDSIVIRDSDDTQVLVIAVLGYRRRQSRPWWSWTEGLRVTRRRPRTAGRRQQAVKLSTRGEAADHLRMPSKLNLWRDLVVQLWESYWVASVLKCRELLLARAARHTTQAGKLLGLCCFPALKEVRGRDLVTEPNRL